MRRLGDVHDVAEACVYLSAPSGRFITAEVLAVDGGGQAWGEFWALGKPDHFKLEE
jgi:citronellol/citronellal dehydrogenase